MGDTYEDDRDESWEAGSGWEVTDDDDTATAPADPSLFRGPYAPAELQLIEVGNDGMWRLWEPFTKSIPPFDLGQFAAADPDDFTRRGGFYFYARDEFSRRRQEGRLSDVPDVAKRVHRLIFVHAAERLGYYELAAYAIEKAAEFCGKPELLTRYHRQPEGHMACPHCGKRYTSTGPFGSHLRGHGDYSGDSYIEGPEFVERFGRSMQAWRKIVARERAAST